MFQTTNQVIYGKELRISCLEFLKSPLAGRPLKILTSLSKVASEVASSFYSHHTMRRIHLILVAGLNFTKTSCSLGHQAKQNPTQDAKPPSRQ